tara:strand:- start:27081 stop:27698 length:618 start_codon:yes stop_codon:yes gene_type:complete
MTTLKSRQPTKLDYASPTQFKFNILKLPKTEYFCTAVNIPGISLAGTPVQQTMLKDIPLPGDKLNYESLTMTFLVDENLENYQEIHGWLRGIGFPEDHKEFQNTLTSGNDRFPGSTSNVLGDAGRTKYAPPKTGGLYSDATLSVLSNKNNSVVEVRFSDVYPTSLSGLLYNQQATDVDYLTASVSFEYKIYDFALTGKQKTVTTS